MEQSKNKKTMLTIIGIAILVIGLIGVTYAFFNYTRTGTRNIIKTGRIYFNSEQDTSINLTNMFPIDVSGGIPNDNTKVGTITINVVGDTTYDEGIEYLVSAVNVSNSVGNKSVPISIDVSITDNSGNDPATTLGTSDNDYYTNRGGNSSIYKVLAKDTISNNDQLLVGYITKGATGIDGNIVIKAYLDKARIAIADTYDGNETDNMGTTTTWVNNRVVFTTTEWNSLQSNGVSFQVKVEANEGIWVENPNVLSKVISRKVSTVNYVRSYDDIITSNPTFGTQDTVGTNANKETVYYYNGNNAAANANVLFAGFCWQIIRTTDTGGVKLIYNGVAENNKCETTRSVTKGINGEHAEYNGISLSGVTLFGRSFDYDLTTGEFTIEDSEELPTAWSASDTNSNGKKDYEELIGTYTCKNSSSTCTTLYYVGSYASNTNAYIASYTIGNVAHYSQMGKSIFNASRSSLPLVGYMFNKEYDKSSGFNTREHYANAVWENGAYTLSNGNSGTKPDTTHRYVCVDNGCTKVRYYYDLSGITPYIILENGKTVEDALKEMINYKTNASDEDENINVHNSAMKGYLDNWYKKNLTDYTSYLDTNVVFCSDRSVRNLGGWGGGTNTTEYLVFYKNSVNRDLKCVNETDRFSMGNNKAKLEYPIGLLTEQERMLMGNNFAATGQNYWGLSPANFYDSVAYVFGVNTSGNSSALYDSISYGVRGVVTLKPGTALNGGTGTYTDPYVIGPLVQR